MKQLRLLSEYFQKHFPDFSVSGTSAGSSWYFELRNNSQIVRIKKFGAYGKYTVRIGNDFYCPKSMTGAFHLLNEKLGGNDLPFRATGKIPTAPNYI